MLSSYRAFDCGRTYPWLLIWIEHLGVSRCRTGLENAKVFGVGVRLRGFVWVEPYASP